MPKNAGYNSKSDRPRIEGRNRGEKKRNRKKRGSQERNRINIAKRMGNQTRKRKNALERRERKGIDPS